MRIEQLQDRQIEFDNGRCGAKWAKLFANLVDSFGPVLDRAVAMVALQGGGGGVKWSKFAEKGVVIGCGHHK